MELIVTVNCTNFALFCVFILLYNCITLFVSYIFNFSHSYKAVNLNSLVPVTTLHVFKHWLTDI